MSIWTSIRGDEDILGLANTTDASNYRAEGEPAVTVDVAVADHFHDHVRLAMWGDLVDAEVLLSPAAVRELITRLKEALDD